MGGSPVQDGTIMRGMMSPYRELIERFYSAFARRDAEGMAACYARDARFSDPVFTSLRGSEPGAMWRMLTARAADLEVDLITHSADEKTGSARWIARYTFGQKGRRVVNDVHASFCFSGGLIVKHRDVFDFYRWARQALGPPGVLLGWTPLMRAAVRRRARADLDEFLARDSLPT